MGFASWALSVGFPGSVPYDLDRRKADVHLQARRACSTLVGIYG